MSDEKDAGKTLDKKPSKDVSSESEDDSDDDRTKEERAYDKAKRRIEVLIFPLLYSFPSPSSVIVRTLQLRLLLRSNLKNSLGLVSVHFL